MKVDLLQRAEELVGPIQRAEHLSSALWRLEASGRLLILKVDRGAADEAEGLRALATVPGAPPVPEVVAVEPGVLIETWIEAGPRSEEAEADLGCALAHLHSAPWPRFGGGSSWIGRCHLGPERGDGTDAVTFYGERLADLAGRCGLEGPVSAVVDRLETLLPAGGPALVHGDLWWGNVRWAADGRAWLIDPSAHGGHPEEDLAMLALFGPVPKKLLAAYREVHPLAPGFEERIALWQLLPLLVHAVLFGGHYFDEALAVAKRYG
jgi:fructosamine-3-kinase